MNSDKKTILVVDDDPKIVKAISVRLVAAGYEILTAFNGVDALTISKGKKPDLIVADIWMPVGVGFSLAQRLRELRLEIPIIFLTASKQAQLRETAREFGAAAFLEKPYEPEVLLATVAQILKSPTEAGHKDELVSNASGS